MKKLVEGVMDIGEIAEEVYSWVLILAVIFLFIFYFTSDSNNQEGDYESRPGPCHGVPGQYQLNDC